MSKMFTVMRGRNSRYKYRVMAHHVSGYKKPGRVLADAGNAPLESLAPYPVELKLRNLV